MFDTSNVTNRGCMFEESKIRTVYARRQANADNFNTSYRKPSGLKLTVK